MSRDGNELRTDRGALVEASQGFGDAAGRLETILSTLRSELEAQGRCWGDDEVGRQFKAGYVPASETGQRVLAEAATALKSIETRLTTMAAVNATTEAAIEADLNRMP